MCGRFTQHYAWKEMHDQLDVFGTPQNLKPNWNVAPTQSVDVVLQVEAGRSLTQMHWGLLPFWAKGRYRMLASRMINARSESVAEKPVFRKAFADRRCIVPASGFFEWKREGKAKPSSLTTSRRWTDRSCALPAFTKAGQIRRRKTRSAASRS